MPSGCYYHIFKVNSRADFQTLTSEHKKDLLNLLRYRHKLRYSNDIKVEGGEEGDSHSQHNIRHLATKIAESIIDSPTDYTPSDFINIFKVVHSSKKRMNILTP